MKVQFKNLILPVATILFILCLIIARNTIENLLRGYVHFPKEYVGDVLKMEDGQMFTVFRRLKVDGKVHSRGDLAVFKVKFKFKNLSAGANKRLSIIPAPFLMGMKGFREKYWTINENTNYFQGIYQWASHEMAEHYPDTFIFKLMTKRAASGTVSYEIIPNTDLSEYLSARRDLQL